MLFWWQNKRITRLADRLTQELSDVPPTEAIAVVGLIMSALLLQQQYVSRKEAHHALQVWNEKVLQFIEDAGGYSKRTTH